MTHPLGPFPHDGQIFMLRLACGPFVRPLSYPFGPNPWSRWRWFTLRIPHICLPFLSVNTSWVHFYIGGKQFQTGLYPDPGHTWMRSNEGSQTFVTTSARFGIGERR